ncbi:fidgetin-like protein 1 [Acropora muricata]|uniref:fidgetin-like protein 1 n=1 Tax=Acropora muricata TaxID=159855 RepID=UPI0034E5138E
MHLSHDDSCALNMWQRLYFEAESSTNSHSRANAWRRLLIQAGAMRKSNEISLELYNRLLQRLATNYHQIADDQKPDQGLNNYAETVLTLASGCRNESRNWSSGLSLSSVHSIPVYTSLLESKRELHTNRPPHSNSFNKNDPKRTSIRLSSLETKALDEENKPNDNNLVSAGSSSDDAADTSLHSSVHGDKKCTHDCKAEIPPAHQFMAAEQLPTVLQLQVPKRATNVQGNEVSREIKRENISVFSNHNGPSVTGNAAGIKRKAPSDCPGTTGPELHNTIFQSFHDQGFADKRILKNTLEKQSCTDIHEETSAMPSFITARQQLVLNSKKKNYHHDSDPKASRQGSINCTNYGNTRKTLGTRRGPSRQFIPPILNQENNNEGLERELKNDRTREDPCVDERLKNIDQKMIELITNEIMDHGPPLSWDDIAGLEFAKSVIKEIVVWPMLRPDIFKGLRGPPKGVLLFGPPGTGKTLIGKCIASQSKATFFSISASSLTSKWVGEGEKMVRALFAVARCHLPAVIFIDEIDSLLSQRTDGENDASRRIKTEFLVQLDGATTSSDDRLLVVGATNRPQEIDEAARRRLVKRLYIPLPDAGAREKIISSLLSEQKYSLTEQDLRQIVHQTQGYSGSDMANLCREAALGPIRSIADIQCVDADQVRPIVFNDFDAALHQVRASVSEKDLILYTEWNKLYGSGSK